MTNQKKPYFVADQEVKLQDLPDIQKHLQEILVEVIKACDSLHLTYFAFFGTLLGVVRHSGFIPWDDDIDIAMPRPDYDRFIAEAQKLLPSYLFVQNLVTEPGYLLYYTKVRDSRTSYFEVTDCFSKINHGLWVDIFPIDGGSDSPLFRHKMKMLFREYGAYEGSRFRSLSFRNEIKGLAKFKHSLVSILASLRFHHEDSHSLLVHVDRLLRKRPFMPKGACWSSFLYFSADALFGPTERYGDFNGLKVRIPYDAERILSTDFGDYMKLPPAEKRFPHHEMVYYNMDLPYAQVDIGTIARPFLKIKEK
jgi:lipopolysaccharide cholinephosphotransferase